MASNVTLQSIKNYTGIKVIYSQIGQSVANNTSTLRASVYQYTTGYSSSYQSGSTVNVTVDGQTKGVWIPPWSVSGQSEWHLGNVDFTVSHNSVGAKSARISYNWDVSYDYYKQSSSGTFNFDTIARASSIGGLTGTVIGQPMYFSISRKSSSYTHQAWYRLPGQAWQNLGTGHTTGVNFNIPLTQLSYLPNSTSGNLEVAIQTKSGSSNIGDEVRKTFKVYVASDIVPSFDSMSIAEGTQSVKDYDYFIQNLSTLKIAIENAKGIYGSTIKSYRIEVDKQMLNAQSGTTLPIISKGNLPVKGTITDSRGRTYSKTQTVKVEAYDLPKFIKPIAPKRVKQNGVDDPLGRYVKLNLDTVVSAIKSNNDETYVDVYAMGDLSPGGVELASSNTALSNLYTISGNSFKVTYFHLEGGTSEPIMYKVALYDSSKRFIKYVESYSTWYYETKNFDRPIDAHFVQFVIAFQTMDNFDERDIPYRTLSMSLEGEFNTTTITIQSKESTSSTYTQKKVINSGLTYKGTETIGLYSVDYSYDFRVLLQDKFKTTIVLGVISEGKVSMQIMDETVAIGFISTEAERNLYVGSNGMKNLGPYYDKDGNELGETIPAITVSVDARYTETVPATWTTTQVKNMSNLVNSTDNYGDYYTVTSNGIRIKKEGLYLVSGVLNFVPDANSKQFDAYVLVNGSDSGLQNLYQTAYGSYFNASFVVPQVIRLKIGDVVRLAYNAGTKVSVTIYEKSKISISRLG